MNISGNQGCRLGLHDIGEIIWQWCYSKMTLSVAAVAVSVSKQKTCNWYANFRWVCGATESTLPITCRTSAKLIYIDESQFAGWRK